MPAFKKPKYSVEQTQEIMMRAFGALCDSETPMTIEEIQQADLFLVSTTTQKMARVLNELVEKGVVVKTKAKSKGGHMVYMSIEVLEKQGFEKEKLVC